MIHITRKNLLGSALISACIAASATASADTENRVIATINGQDATEQQIKTFFLMQGPATGLDLKDPQAQAQLFKLFIEREILYQEALKQGIDKRPEVAATLEELKRQEIAKVIIETHAKKHPITEEQIKARYEEQYGPDKTFELKLSHIQLASKEDADKVIVRLNKGGDFNQLASELSNDTSAANGGDIGWHSLQRLPDSFGNAIKNLSPGQYTNTAVKSELGWHIIKVDEKRPTPPPPYDSVKQELYGQLQNQLISDYIDEIKQKSIIEMKR